MILEREGSDLIMMLKAPRTLLERLNKDAEQTRGKSREQKQVVSLRDLMLSPSNCSILRLEEGSWWGNSKRIRIWGTKCEIQHCFRALTSIGSLWRGWQQKRSNSSAKKSVGWVMSCCVVLEKTDRCLEQTGEIVSLICFPQDAGKRWGQVEGGSTACERQSLRDEWGKVERDIWRSRSTKSRSTSDWEPIWKPLMEASKKVGSKGNAR